ncbi:MAG: NAD(P)/FAD-dependent oxidoreductase [Gemmatimonadetes bacterium]|nr:MAG: NAD(P)/FAD-dependent oxidoreductase [Gemmatimonadota bacterium]
MAKDFLKGAKDYYDVVVIGSGLGGLTSANILAKAGHSVLLLEHHYQFGGLATWFHRKGGHIFDISLHGFPYGMVKSCRKYWTKEIASHIHQLKGVIFDNPQFKLETTFDRKDFSRIMVDKFGIDPQTVENFFDTARSMNFYDDQQMTTRELFQQFFPGRTDVWRLLMEPITYANGSTLDDPAISYGIVFSNFMNKGVFTFDYGTDQLIGEMVKVLKSNGVDLRKNVRVERVIVEGGKVAGIAANGRVIKCKAVLSNANVLSTIFKLTGEEYFSPDFIEEARKVRVNTSSCQVYIGIRQGESIPYIGDLIFTSTAPEYNTDAMLDMKVTSRTFSVYYDTLRSGKFSIVSSTNARFDDWNRLSKAEYQQAKDHLIEDTLNCLEKYLPDIRAKVDHLEASTPCTFKHYTLHPAGTSFGTKFEGLKISQGLPEQVPGLYHAGSVAIIMSGWLGAINYGVITSNNVDKYLRA